MTIEILASEDSGDQLHRLEVEFPVDFDERSNALISAINNGSKAVTILLFPPYGEYIPTKDLNDAFFIMHRGSSITRIRRYITNKYCLQTLCPIGLVAEEVTVQSASTQELVGFSITRAGDHYGRLAAALFLQAEKDIGISLYHVFGSTHSNNERRSPFIRAQILLYMYKHVGSEVSIKQFANDAGLFPSEHTSVSPLFTLLANVGAITLESKQTHTRNNISHFERTNISAESIDGAKIGNSLVQQVIPVCEKLHEEGKAISIALITDRIIGMENTKRERQSLSTRIAYALGKLVKAGYLQRVDRFGEGINSFTSLTPLGEKIIRLYLLPLQKLVCDDEYITRILRDRVLPEVLRYLNAYAVNSGELYYPYSISYLSINRLNIQREIIEVIRASSNPLGITTKEIVNQLGFLDSSVGDFLTKHSSAFGIKRTKLRGVIYYKIKE